MAASGGPKKPAAAGRAKKPATVAGRARKKGTDKPNQRTKARASVASTAAPKDAPRGPRLSAARQAIRDNLMIQRLAQDWTWEAIAAEAGISVSQARRAVKARQEAVPLRFRSDPVEIVEKTMQGLQLSITDLEALASAAVESGNLAVAVGAKKGANEAREKVMALLQATGRLPQEMGALRHLIDLRAIAVRMLDAMDDFERDMALVLRLDDDAERRQAAREAAGKVRTTFGQLIGMDEEPPVEGTANELPEAVG